MASTGENSAQARLLRLVESPNFVRFITTIILINAVTLGLQTSQTVMARAGDLILIADRVFLAIYVIEIAMKFGAYRQRFFSSGWRAFDFTIVAIALVPAAESIAVLRSLRIMRVLRLISVVPQMRRVVGALLTAIPGMGVIMLVLLLIFYVSAVLATMLFGSHPNPDMQTWFGTIGRSMYTLFQVMTLESWSMGIVRPTMQIFPNAWVFFVAFIIVTSFAVLNLFIAIIVNAMDAQNEEERQARDARLKEAAHADSTTVLNEVKALRAEVNELRDALPRRDDRP